MPPHGNCGNSDCDSLVVGCGIGELDAATAASLLDLIANSPAPAVIDADALNLIAKSGKTGILAERHVITPHPGEFHRLAPDLAGLSREMAARAFADRIPATLLLKGCRTLVTRSGHPLWCNATGNPGMATGGQGDLLAGVIGARLAIGDTPLEAAALAAWLCGRAPKSPSPIRTSPKSRSPRATSPATSAARFSIGKARADKKPNGLLEAAVGRLKPAQTRVSSPPRRKNPSRPCGCGWLDRPWK